MLESKVIEVSPQLYKKDYTFVQNSVKGKKAQRAETIYTATVTYNDWVFDADEDSMNRMNRHIQIANYDFNYELSNDVASNDAYRTNYIFKTVEWKLADNSVQTVTIEQLMAVYKLAVDNMTTNWI
jgi:hypothetical protein